MTEQLLYTLGVTDASLADTVSCSIASTTPSTTNFFSRINAGSTGNYVIFFFFFFIYNQYATAENRLSFFCMQEKFMKSLYTCGYPTQRSLTAI